MLGQCIKCNDSVGIIYLKKGLCKQCLSKTNKSLLLFNSVNFGFDDVGVDYDRLRKTDYFEYLRHQYPLEFEGKLSALIAIKDINQFIDSLDFFFKEHYAAFLAWLDETDLENNDAFISDLPDILIFTLNGLIKAKQCGTPQKIIEFLNRYMLRYDMHMTRCLDNGFCVYNSKSLLNQIDSAFKSQL